MPKKLREPTKKEYRKLKKQLTEQRTNKRRKLIKSATIWLGVVLGLVVAVLGMIKFTSRQQPELTRLADQNSVVNWIKGNKSAQIILVEYSDFECSSCARYYRITKRLTEELGNDFYLNFRHFPLVMKHANALLAAKSAEAAGRQGKFWEMHDLLFERQQEWMKKKNEYARKLFVQYAVSLKLNVQRFQSDLDSQAVKNKVQNDAQAGHRSGVKGTPTFFLNGQEIVINPPSYEAFKDLILKSKLDLS
jgi:protein-disulfide isomerase